MAFYLVHRSTLQSVVTTSSELLEQAKNAAGEVRHCVRLNSVPDSLHQMDSDRSSHTATEMTLKKNQPNQGQNPRQILLELQTWTYESAQTSTTGDIKYCTHLARFPDSNWTLWNF